MKAKILPKGFIAKHSVKGRERVLVRPEVGYHERLYEIMIIEVFKGPLGKQLEVNIISMSECQINIMNLL